LVAGELRVHLVPPEGRGERLDQRLALAFPDLSRSRIQALIDGGQVSIDGRPARPALRVRGGERIELCVPPAAPATPLAQALPLAVLYEDPDLVVLDKAPGMVVHPAAGHAEGTLVNALLHRLTDLGGVGGEKRPGLVHRLDKDTSGCMVVAKNDLALNALQAAFKERRVKKTYLAIVHLVPPPGGRIVTLYGRHPVHRKRFTGKVREGKSAVTHYEVKEAFEGAALLEVDLLTGRTHQIRVHLAEAGHPLLGDVLYGGTRKGKGRVAEAQTALGRQALHAARLHFAHPRSGAPLQFEAPLPADFARALELLRGG
jgi:23S rRNA pseudouridine1911/1915/1917 synthase